MLVRAAAVPGSSVSADAKVGAGAGTHNSDSDIAKAVAPLPRLDSKLVPRDS